MNKTHFADRLLAAIKEKGSPVCVGIDPNLAYLPEEYIDNTCEKKQADLVGDWAIEVLKIVAPIVPSVKPQVAYFEQLAAGEDDPFYGMKVYARVVKAAQELGLIVIGDAKRGDIGSTATAYASAHLRHENSADSLTVNGYFGMDGTKPFVDASADTGRGIFVLVRTSNPSGTTIQNFQNASGEMFYQHMAKQVAEMGASCVGESGYSCVGAVVGATCPDEARELRKLMPQQIFLVPGYGAQGATAKDCAASFKEDGTGAIVNASRSVIYAHKKPEFEGLDWKEAVKQAAEAFAKDIAGAL